MDMYEKRKQRKNKKEEMNNVEQNQTKTNINWYPGHMVTAQNEIKDSLKLIDIAIEVLDARIPFSSRNPLIDKLAHEKARIVILNKCDLADSVKTAQFKKYFTENGVLCIENDAQNPSNIKRIIEQIKEVGKKVYEKKYEQKQKKIDIKPIYRVLIAGIPNVGKSTIINKIAGKPSANVGNKPGVTKKKQWIRVADNIDLLDTPGLLWPNLDDKDAGIHLALTGNIKQEVLDVEELACIGIDLLQNDERYQKMLMNKYKLEPEDFEHISYDILEIIGKKRGCIVSGGHVDMTKAANIFLEELKSGKIGRVTLDCIENE